MIALSLRKIGLGITAGLLAAAPVRAEVTVHAGNAPPAEEATLFAFDDLSIPLRQNLRVELKQPRKHPANPVVPLGKEGEPDHWSVQFYGSIIRHEGRFKLWYVAADKEAFDCFKNREGFRGWRPAYAESEDGIHWTKPDLGLVEYKGDKDNNLLLVEPEQSMGLHLVVLHEPDDPDPEKRFKMMQTVPSMFDGTFQSTSVTLFSPDGLRWKAPKVEFENWFLKEETLILPREHFEQGGLYKWNGMYHLPGQQIHPWASRPDGRSAGRVMTILRSADLLEWPATKALGFVRHAGEAGEPVNPGKGREAHLAASVWNRGNVLIGLYGHWNGAETNPGRTMDLGLLVSNDGLQFREPVRDFVYIPRGPDGEWDQGGLLQGQGFENVGDQTFLYYGHWDLRLLEYQPRGGVGLATVPRDRLGALSIQQPNLPASFATCLLETGGAPEIWLNATGVTGDAPLKIDLLDEHDRPITGWSGMVSKSGLRVPVSWKRTSREKITKPFRVRASFGRDPEAEIFAVYLR